MRSDSAKRNALEALLYIVSEGALCKTTIICMVMFDFHVASSAKMLKIMLCLMSLIARLIGHQSNMNISRNIVDVNRSRPDSCSCKDTFILRN